MGEQISIQTDAGAMTAYVARPTAAKAPAVVVIQEIFGVNPFVRGVADALAAEGYLAEAQLIAGRGPMPLHLADVHLHRARLFGPLPPAERAKFPHIDPRADLAEARRLIEHHRYGRRKEELEDAEAAAGNW